MKRLTKRGVELEEMIWFTDHENNELALEPCKMSPHHNRLLLEKVAEYEDKEEKGLMFILPAPLTCITFKSFPGRKKIRNN